MNSDEMRQDLASAINKLEQEVAKKNIGSGDYLISSMLAIGTPYIVEIAAQLADAHVSLRDRFAMAALQGFISCDSSGNTFWPHDKGRSDISSEAYKWADAMMQARTEKKEE